MQLNGSMAFLAKEAAHSQQVQDCQ